MLVINEADISGQGITARIDAWKTAYSTAQGEQARLSALDRILKEAIGSSSYKNVLDFGWQFLDAWINAMKWEELGNPDNEFINLLSKSYGSEPYLKNKENFTKIYNVYASNLIRNSYVDNKVFKRLIENDRLYQSDADIIKKIFSHYNNLKGEKKIDDNLIEYIFFEDPDDPSSDVRNITEIDKIIKNEGIEIDTENTSKNEDDLDKLMNRFKDAVINNPNKKQLISDIWKMVNEYENSNQQ